MQVSSTFVSTVLLFLLLLIDVDPLQSEAKRDRCPEMIVKTYQIFIQTATNTSKAREGFLFSYPALLSLVVAS